MDKLPKKSFKMHSTSAPVSSPGVATSIEPLANKNVMATVSKWVPLICAGGAIGISIFALKEIKNTRRELINLKKEQYTAPNNDKLEKKIIRSITKEVQLTDFKKF